MRAITVKNLSKKFKKVSALDGVTTTFEFGKIYGLLGRNGAGKSTLIKIMTNRIFADSGSIEIEGETTCENPNLHNLIYFMTEENFYSTMRIKLIFNTTESFHERFDKAKAYEYAALFGLNTKQKFSNLSTGYKNILKLIIALCIDVPYLVFDEPVVGLDAYHRELFYKLLLKCYGEGERTIILATHLIEEVSSIVEDIVIINNGKVLICDNVENLTARGYSVGGAPQLVSNYTKNKNVIDTEEIGGLKIAYILEDRPEEIDPSLIISPLSLQKIFVRLTGGNENERIS